MTSWELFDYLLENANVVGTPGQWVWAKQKVRLTAIWKLSKHRKAANFRYQSSVKEGICVVNHNMKKRGAGSLTCCCVFTAAQ